MPTIGKRIHDRRVELGLSVDELAAKLGKNRATVYRYEQDEIKDIPSSVIRDIAAALDTTSGVLLGEASFMELVAATEGNKLLMAYYEWNRNKGPDNPYFTLPKEVRDEIYGEEKPTIPEDDGLTENQRLLMQFARTVPADKAEMILRVMKSIVEAG